MEFYRIFIKGHVQGVGFRYYLRRLAEQYNLAGYVRNLDDGVEVVVNDNDFIKKIGCGPPFSKISNKTIEKIGEKNYKGFSVLNTTRTKNDKNNSSY